MRLGIFGGTFDPVHYGHLLLAECCREQCRLDEVWFLPAATPPHKQEADHTPGEARVDMLRLAIGGHAEFSVSTHEIDRGGVNYTVDTLAALRQQMPDAELYFLLGGDMFLDLPQWREPARLAELAALVAVGRPPVDAVDFSHLEGILPEDKLAAMRRNVVEMPAVGISGSEIRRRVAAGQSIRYRTPRAVEKYIETHGLYRPHRLAASDVPA
ncbi:MAG: nicotinate-nucleotide adenylyltransferase [Pirellulales bacterium]